MLMENETTEIKKEEGFNGQKAIVLPRSILVKTCIPVLSWLAFISQISDFIQK